MRPVVPIYELIQGGNLPPDMVLGTQIRDGKVVRTRPLCPYPAYPHYKGSGSIDQAENFECRQ